MGSEPRSLRRATPKARDSQLTSSLPQTGPPARARKPEGFRPTTHHIPSHLLPIQATCIFPLILLLYRVPHGSPITRRLCASARQRDTHKPQIALVFCEEAVYLDLSELAHLCATELRRYPKFHATQLSRASSQQQQHVVTHVRLTPNLPSSCSDHLWSFLFF